MLHQSSSTTELRVRIDLTMRVSFYPYFAIKDLFMLLLIIAVYCTILFYAPEIFNHSVNYIPANLLVTPSHIVPE
jgi:ubiquinol-cytochrome c reductase cytochrome b subunit